MEVEFSRQIF